MLWHLDHHFWHQAPRHIALRLQGTAVARAVAVVGAWKTSWNRIHPVGPGDRLSLIVIGGSHSEAID